MIHLRTLSATALRGAVKGFADKLGKALKRAPGEFGTKSSVYDGFILRAQRFKKRIVVTVIDPPALVVLTGPMTHPADPSVDESPVLSLPRGRDTFAFPQEEDVSLGEEQALTTVGPNALQVVGTPVVHSYTFYGNVSGSSGECAFFVPDIGVLRSFALLTGNQPYSTNPYAFLPRSAGVRYFSYCIAPPIQSTVYAPGSWEPRDTFSQAEWARYGLVIFDSVLRDRGYLPYAMREEPPEYDPESTDATEWQVAQAPWHHAVANVFVDDSDPEEPVTTCRITVCTQCVLFMNSDIDKYGARGLWFGTYHITPEECVLVGEYTLDPRLDGEPLARPYLQHEGGEPGDELFFFNCYLRVGPSMLRSGIAVFITPFMALQPADGRHITIDAVLIGQDGSLVDTFRISNAERENVAPCVYYTCIGSAVKLVPDPPEGEDPEPDEVIAVFFSPSYTIQTVLTVVAVDEDGATELYSANAFIWPAMGCTQEALFSSGSAGIFHTPWSAFTVGGGGGNQVCYIGNDKYLFYGTTAVDLDFPVYGNLAAIIYDRVANTITVAGIIDPVLRSSSPSVSPFTLGKPDCTQLEVADDLGNITQLATIIATRGGWSYGGGDYPGVEGGTTWVSHDSGVTWVEIASDGSPSGALYVGNIIQPRA